MQSSAQIVPDLLMSGILALTIVGMYLKPYRPHCTRILGACLLVDIVACLCDALVSVTFLPELRFLQELVLYVYWISGDMLLISFIWYSCAYIAEKTSISRWFHIVPTVLLCMGMAVLIVMCAMGELFTIDNGVVTYLSRKPMLISLFNVLAIFFVIFLGIRYRKVIGPKPALFVVIFGIMPFITRIYAFKTGTHDFTYLAAGISLMVAYLFLDHQIVAELEHRQRLKSDHYHDIISRSGNGVWTILISPDKAPSMECDQKMKLLLGIEPFAELSPEQVYDFWYSNITPEALPSVQASVKKMMEGHFDENTYLWLHPRKGRIYVRCGGQAVKKSDGSYRLSGYHADVTDIVLADRQRAQELQDAREEAEAANAAKTSFLFNMSHDIRTPMNAIIGFTNLLRKHQEEPQKREDYLNKIEHSSTVLLSIINNVLEMARIEKGTISVEEKATSLKEFGDMLLRHHEDFFRNKGIDFSIKYNLQHEHFLTDTTKMGEIFRNLLSNACKYTEQGKVEMLVEELPSDKMDTAIIRSTITDTGIGMSEEFLPHIFEEFSRENNTTDNKIEGTGLGMPIVKRLVELLDGTIQVTSKKGVGSTFVVSLPHRIADSAEEKVGMDIDTSLFEGKRILLAEDNDLNAEIATEILTESGLLVERASDGKHCLEMLEHAADNYYDIILMDIQMPRMNGYEATCAIRSLEDKAKAEIPILAMTANAFEEDKRQAMAVGMNGHIAKPVDIGDLMQKLSQIFVR